MNRRSFLIALPLGLAACSQKPSEKQYELRGDIVGIEPRSQSAVIKGDKVEGWMEAMTMEYPVKGKAEFDKLAVGDRITATIFVSGDSYHIGEIKVVGKAASAAPAK